VAQPKPPASSAGINRTLSTSPHAQARGPDAIVDEVLARLAPIFE